MWSRFLFDNKQASKDFARTKKGFLALLDWPYKMAEKKDFLALCSIGL